MTTLHPSPEAALWLVPAAATVVCLCGELDLSTSEAVRERLQGALHRSTGLLILDLSGVSFCDAAGLSVVVGIQDQARALDIVIALATPRPHVAKVLQLADLDHSFPMYGTIAGTGVSVGTGSGADGAGSSPASAH